MIISIRVRFFGPNSWTHPNKKSKAFFYNYFSFVFPVFSIGCLHEIYSFKLIQLYRLYACFNFKHCAWALNWARLACCSQKLCFARGAIIISLFISIDEIKILDFAIQVRKIRLGNFNSWIIISTMICILD